MKTWLVTGASGFLGANAAQFLSQRTNCYGLARIGSKSNFPKTLRCDLTDMNETRRLLFELKPNVILHTAAMSSHESCEQDKELARKINAELTQQLAQIAVEINARFIYISTDAVFDGRKGNYAETDEPNPFSTYGETKLIGEIKTTEVNIEALIIRTNFFGWSPNGKRSILEFFIKSLREGKAVPGYDNFVVSSLYAQDLLEAIWKLEAEVASGLFHVGSRDSLSKYEFGLSVSKVFDFDSNFIQRIPAPIIQGISRDRNLSLSTSKYIGITKTPLPSQLEGILRARQLESATTDFFENWLS